MAFQSRYSRWDRLLHKLAFGTVALQKALADLEDRIYAPRLRGIALDRPVFITSLPRAGTTLLLEILSARHDFAAHTYRQMPFLLIPLLWDALTRSFQTAGADVERAHGDGLTVSYDSAEAFEEVLWRAFHPRQYQRDRIAPWTADGPWFSDEFGAFMQSHVRKVLALRMDNRGTPGRYVSKNNGNIARLPTLAQLFPDAALVIPFRNPTCHAASMWRQHQRFAKIHAAEAFTRQYMADIGHFEFGANLRPVDFNGWLDRKDRAAADTARFWLQYWCAAFQYILALPDSNRIFVSYDRLCADPDATFQRLGAALGLDEPAKLGADADIRAARNYDVEALALEPSLLARASALHQMLLERAV